MVDSMIHSSSTTHEFLNWYVWNAEMYPDTTVEHKHEDAGLVFREPGRLQQGEGDESSSPTKVLTVVMSCHKNKHLWKGILDKGIDDLIIIVGNEGMQNVYPPLSSDQLNVQQTMRLEGHMLYLGCNDCYEGLPIKIIKMIDFVLRSEQFRHITHIIKIDDDNKFDKQAIQNIHTLEELKERTQDFIGQKLNSGSGMRNYHFPNVSVNSHWRNRLYEGDITPWLHGGSSYILSRWAMRVINAEYNVCNIDHVNWNEIFEDVMVAKILRKNNIFPKKLDYGIIGDRP